MLYLFRSHETFSGLYDNIFGGIFRREGLPELLQFCVPVLFSLAVMGWLFHRFGGKRHFAWLSMAFSLAGFACLVFLTSQPWDELFVNLRHSFYLAREGNFSFNPGVRTEGTVDFLLYYTLGILGKWGLPLIESALVASFLGGVACLFCISKWASRISGTRSDEALYFLLAGLFPPLVYNSGQGFSTTLFAAAILWGAYVILFMDSLVGGLFILSLVPLIRPEGAFAGVLLILFVASRKRSWKAVPAQMFLMLIPLILLSVWRYSYFGSPIPIPIVYKSSFGSLFYLKMGIRSLLRDLFHSTTFLWIGLAILASIANRKNRALYWMLPGLFFLFVLPYYLSGGDWFPAVWARYLLPMSLVALACGLPGVRSLATGNRELGIASMLWAFFALANPSLNAYSNFRADVFGPQAGRGDYRVQQLSIIGRHLERSTEPQDVIASSEVATVMYFSNRKGLDLLGVANLEIAKQPLRNDTSPAFRRIAPQLISKYRPAIVWGYDYTTFISPKGRDSRAIADALEERHARYDAANDLRFGGRNTLEKLGYRSVVICDGERFSTLYWVSPEIWERHRARLLELGFKLDTVPSQNAVNSIS